MSENTRWYDIPEEVSIRVSLAGEPFRLDFYDYESVKEIDQENEKKRLKEGEKIAPHIDKGEDFLGKSRHTGIRKRLTNSTLDIDKKRAEKIINNFGRSVEEEEDLKHMLEALDSNENKKEGYEEMDEEMIEEMAEEWLDSPELLSKVVRVVHHHLAGETKNSLLVFLMILSSKTQKPGSLRPVGKSAVGKSYIVENVGKLFPDDMVIMRTSFSEMAPWNKAKPTNVDRVRDWNLWGKCIIIKEEENSEAFLRQFRDVLARNDPVNIYEVTNTESQKRETLYVRMVGWPAYVGLRVSPLMEEQEASRAMSMTPNAGEEKYSKSMWFQGYKEQSVWLDDLRKRETEVLKKAIDKLDRYNVIIPHLKEIQKYFPSSQSENQRHYLYFLALVRAITILHQRQRPIVRVDGEDHLISAPSDVKAVLKIAEKALEETISGIDSRAQRFWERLKSLDEVKGYSGLQDVYKGLFGERMSKTTMRRKFVTPLEERNLIEIDEGKGSNPHVFSAGGKLSTLSSNIKKMEKACSKEEIENSWFGDLYRNMEHVQEVVLRNCPKLESNPLKNPTMRDFQEAWNYLKGDSMLQYNEDVLNRSYKEDYSFKHSNGEMEDKVDKEKEKESEPPTLDLGEGEEEAGEEDKSQEELISDIFETIDIGDYDRQELTEHLTDTGYDRERIRESINKLLDEGDLIEGFGKTLEDGRK